MTITYNSITLTDASTFEDDPGIILTKTRLYSGKQYVNSSTETIFEPSFVCWTETYSEITSIRALIGSPYTLVIDSTSYTKMYIEKFKSKQYAPGKWRYEISFTQDTT